MEVPGSAAIRLHVEMLQDRGRTQMYLDAIRSAISPDDVVVDIGTGTGILAVAAAQAGARHVYAIEGGPIAGAAREIIAANRVEDRITLLRGWSTEIELPEQANVLVSELIGNEPLAEGVLSATADARSRLLTLDARFLPARLRSLCVPVSLPPRELNRTVFTRPNVNNWSRWYGIEFMPLVSLSKTRMQRTFVNSWSLRGCVQLSSPAIVFESRLATCKNERVDARFSMSIEKSGEFNGLLFYFEAELTPRHVLSTGPVAVTSTNHWLSPLWVLGHAMPVRPGMTLRVEYRYDPDERITTCDVERS